jgi:SPP1 gp7 family putative phage head morphogenesis protein
MMTVTDANTDLEDAATRRGVYVLRYATALGNRVVAVLDSDVPRIRELVANAVALGRDDLSALQGAIRAVEDARGLVFEAALSQAAEELGTLAVHEEEATRAMVAAVMPVAPELRKVASTTLQALVNTEPFEGALLKQWWSSMASSEARRVRHAIRRGVVEGQAVEEVVRTIVGTRQARYRDGILDITRRNARALVRTAVQTYSSKARDLSMQANSDLVQGVKWISTLDGRTSAICRSRDGQLYPADSGPRPPAHWNCRSAVTPVLKTLEDMGFTGLQDAHIEGSRPYVRSGSAVKDFPKLARRQLKVEMGEARWKALSKAQRDALVKGRRDAMKAALIGRVPASTTYEQWLKRQPAAFQKDVLGAKRYDLFSKGKISMDRFVDEASGREYTLAELRAQAARDAQLAMAWKQAFGEAV